MLYIFAVLWRSWLGSKKSIRPVQHVLIISRRFILREEAQPGVTQKTKAGLSYRNDTMFWFNTNTQFAKTPLKKLDVHIQYRREIKSPACCRLSVCLYVCVCLFVCLSVPHRIPTLLHGLGCNFVKWYGVPPSCTLLDRFAIGVQVSLL